MKYLNFFKEYLLEQNTNTVENEQPTDPMSVSKNFNLKDLQNKMKEYQSQIGKVKTVFLNDKLPDEKIADQLREYLKNKDVKKFVFNNEFTQLEADICNLARQVRKKEMELGDFDKQIKSTKTSPLEPDTENITRENISKMKSDKESVSKDLQRLRELLVTKEKTKNEVLDDFDEKIKNLRKEILTNK